MPPQVPPSSSTGAPAAVKRRGDGVLRRLVTQGHLSRDVEQRAAGGSFEVAPEGAGPERHVDVVGLGIAEAEDARVALGAGALVAGRPRRLQDQHVPAPPGQGPGAGEPEEARADHDASSVVGHQPSIIRTAAAGPPSRRGRGSTLGVGDEWDGRVDARGARRHPRARVTHEADAPVRRRRPSHPFPGAARRALGRTAKALRTVGFHLVALACFTVPAVVLWWHVWSGHPSSALTCGCGDPAQEVWFMAWPAWAITHLHSVVFSGAVNVPHGANLLSNTSGPLVGVVLAPVTWLFGPVTATNVALTLAPALSAWACFAAIRPLVTWKAGAIPAALVFGYSAALVTSLTLGHVSVTVLVIPPFLFTTLHEIVIRQEHSESFATALVLAALLVVQFFISPEILVMCLLLGAVGMVAVALVGWRQLRPRAGHALPVLGIAAAVTVAVLAYPAWFGLAGPQAVTGVLFALAPISGVPLAGLLVPGPYGSPAAEYIRFGGYLGRTGPPPDYVGWGVALAGVGSLIAARRRPLTWLLLLLAVVDVLAGARGLSDRRPVLARAPLAALARAVDVARPEGDPAGSVRPAGDVVPGLPAGGRPRRAARHAPTPDLVAGTEPLRAGRCRHRRRGGGGLDARSHHLRRTAARRARPHAVLPARRGDASAGRQRGADRSLRRLGLGATDAVAGHAGHALPTGRRRPQDPQRTGRTGRGGCPRFGPPHPDATSPSSARRCRRGRRPNWRRCARALHSWQVDQVVITGASRDPVYASGFFTAALGVAPVFERRRLGLEAATGGDGGAARHRGVPFGRAGHMRRRRRCATCR